MLSLCLIFHLTAPPPSLPCVCPHCSAQQLIKAVLCIEQKHHSIWTLAPSQGWHGDKPCVPQLVVQVDFLPPSAGLQRFPSQPCISVKHLLTSFPDPRGLRTPPALSWEQHPWVRAIQTPASSLLSNFVPSIPSTCGAKRAGG